MRLATKAGWVGFVVGGLLLGTACSRAEAGVDTPDRTGPQAGEIAVVTLPSIHVRQTAVYVKHGKPWAESEYRSMVTACKKAPHMRVIPVPAEDVGKLGRIFYEFWYQGHQLKGHAEAWGWTLDKDDPGTCRFHVVHSIREEIAGPDGSYAINMNKGVARLDKAARFLPQALPDSSSRERVADSQKQAVMAILRENGYGGVADMVEVPKTRSKVAGQPCTRTDSPDLGTSCVWSGGAQWGFETTTGSSAMLFTWIDHLLTGVGQLTVPYGGLTLLNKPPSDGYGWRLTTQSMTVGKPLAHGIFELPPNIDIKPEES